MKGEKRIVRRYAKCHIEGCNGNVIPEMTLRGLPLCAKHTDIIKCLLWALNNLEITKETGKVTQSGLIIPVTSDGLGMARKGG